MKQLPKRKKLETRFKNFEGHSTFFVTMVCKNRKKILSCVRDQKVELTPLGLAIDTVWNKIPEHFQQVKLGEYVLMPDHFHGIIEIRPKSESENISLAKIIHWFKTFSSVEYAKYTTQNRHLNFPKKLWIRGYNEQWIGDGAEYSAIEEYIRTNPVSSKELPGDDPPELQKNGPG